MPNTVYADSTRAQVLIRPETLYNEAFVLGTNHMQDLRFSGETLKAAKEVVDDDEIRSDGSMGRSTLVGRSVSGDINATLSYGTYDPYIAAALRNPVTGWATNALGVGTAPATFAIQRSRLDVLRYILFTGNYINTMTLDIQVRRKIGLSFGILGAQALASVQTSVDPAPIARTTSYHMRAGAGITGLNLGINNGAIGTHPGKVTSLRLQTNAGLRARNNIQSDVSDVMGISEFGVTATISGYLLDDALHDACLAHQDVALNFTTADVAGNSYQWWLDRATIQDHAAPADAKNKDVMNSYTIQAYGANALRVIRVPAA